MVTFATMQKYLWLMLTLVVVSACAPPQLERPDVPIAWGMRLNAPEDAAEINPNLAKMRELVLRNLVLELPLVADTTGLPKAKVDAPRELGGLLSTYRVHLQLAFCNNNEQELFPIGKPLDPGAWFAQLGREIKRNLDLLPLTPPDRVIVGGDLLQVANETERWRELLDGLRTSYPKTSFSIGGRTTLLAQSELGALSDEITIDYLPMAGDELKAACRAENQRINALTSKYKKPLYIYRANIIGPDALLQVKNRLRFWPAEMKFNGLCINSLYAKIAARDDHTYYGLADDADVLAYLEEYRRTAYE